MALPANISTGRVTGQFIVGVADGADVDDEPDFIAASGTVAFTASTPYLPNPTASPNPVTMLKTTILAVLDSEGYICTPSPSDPTVAGKRGIRLVATDDPDASVEGWTWKATPQFLNVNGTVIHDAIKTFDFALPSGATVDLTTVVKVPASQGIGTEQAEAAAWSAQQAALEASAAAALSAAEAAAVKDKALANDAGVASFLTTGVRTTSALAGVIDTQIKATGGGLRVVNHGSLANTPRPNITGQVLWLGEVAPTNRIAGDMYYSVSPEPVPWSPKGLSLLAWHDAQDLTYGADGAVVSSILDKSGGGRHLSIKGGAGSVTLTAKGMNGFRGFNFPGTAYLTSTTTTPYYKPITVFLVAKLSASTSTQVLFDGGGVARNAIYKSGTGNSDSWVAKGTSTQPADLLDTGQNTADALPHVIAAKFEADGMLSELELVGLPKLQKNIGGGLIDSHRLGASNSGANLMTGVVGELIIARNPSSENYAECVAYLKARWGL
jgi:hypothetical protein